MEWQAEHLTRILVSLLMGCVTPGQALSPSTPQFSHGQHGLKVNPTSCRTQLVIRTCAGSGLERSEPPLTRRPARTGQGLPSVPVYTMRTPVLQVCSVRLQV